MAKSAPENRSFGGIAVPLISVWSAALLIAFLAYRGSDVGQIGKLAGNLGGGPLVGNGAFESLFGVIVAGLVLAAWVGVGGLIYTRLQIRLESDALALAMMASMGSAFWSLIWFFVGLAGGYYWPVGIAAIVLGIIPLFVRLGQKRLKFRRDLSGSEWLIIFLIGSVFAISLIAALAPPTAKDTLLYHFALPKAFISQHNNAFVEGNIAGYLALGNEMHSVWAMLLGGLFDQRAGEAAAGAVSFLFFPLLLLAAYGWAREMKIERRWSLIAALMVASIPTAFHVAASAYIDLGLSLYITLAIFALGRWWQDQEKKWLALAAIVLGAALSIKLTAVFVFAAFALIILLRARNDKAAAGKIVGVGFAALLLAGVIASPWYLRTWKATGSPVFPFYMSIWPGDAAGWDVERSNLFQTMNAQYGGAEKGVLDYVLTPVKLSVTAQPEYPEHYDGVIGVAFLIGLPILIWALWKFDTPIEIKIGAGVAGIIFLFWLFSSQQLRYLLPILPVLAIGIVSSAGLVAEKINGLGKAIQASMVLAAVAGILVSIAWFLQIAPLRVVLGGESRDAYLTRNLDYYPYYHWLNTETSPDSRVWLINMRRDTYDLDRPVFSDYLFEDWTLRKMVWDARSLPELKAKTVAMGIKYILTRHDFLFDYDRSTIVDDKKSRAENEAKLKLAKDLILDPTNTIKSDARFSLIKVFTKK